MIPAHLRQQLDSSLTSLSSRLSELVAEARLAPHPLPPELLDQIASSAGELMLTLAGFRGEHPADELVEQAIADARRIREAVRSQRLGRARVEDEADELRREVDEIVRFDRRAA
ncbi:MAG TPA: hypothetical protein VEY09_04250 [Pyrinomonadaceae bacterium]|nr:hypothetical protein [Pyrinomonadaceae bacterium]